MLFDSSHFLALIRLCTVARIDIDIDATTDGQTTDGFGLILKTI